MIKNIGNYFCSHAGLTFFIVPIHTKPLNTAVEIDALSDVFKSAAKHFKTDSGGACSEECIMCSTMVKHEITWVEHLTVFAIKIEAKSSIINMLFGTRIFSCRQDKHYLQA